MKKTIWVVGSTLVLAFLLMQLVPYRISNPKARLEPTWDSKRTRELAVTACYDCTATRCVLPGTGK